MKELNPRAWIPSLNRYATGFDDLYYHRQMNREGEWWCCQAGEDEFREEEERRKNELSRLRGKSPYFI